MNRRLNRLLMVLTLVCALPARAAQPLEGIPEIALNSTARLAHDPAIFTQGLVIHAGLLYESSGQYGESRVIARTLEHADPLINRAIPPRWFGEGLTVLANVAWLITWREGIAQSLSLPSLQPVGQFRYRGEGWGLTTDGEALIMSDGSNRLQWRSAEDFALLRTLSVTARGTPVARLNELEWVDGWILANIWLSEWIVGIDPRSGKIAFKLSTAGLLSGSEARTADVANGIARDPASGALFVTGKYWPWLFRVEPSLPPAPGQRGATASPETR